MSRLRLAALFFILPFFLQLLGFGDTPLGGGLCGALFTGRALPLNLQPPGFWYALLFMILLALLLGYGLSLLLLPLLEVRPSPAWLGLGRGMVGVLLLLFLLTRTTGLPVPGPQGLTLERAPIDPLSLLLVGLALVGGVFLGENRGHGTPA